MRFPSRRSCRDGVIVVLSVKQCAFSYRVGVAWHEAAVKRGRRHTNGLIADEVQTRKLKILSARTECAAWRFLRPIKWHWEVFEDPTGMPDLGKRVQVKGVAGVLSPTLIAPPNHRREPPPRDHAYLLVDATRHPKHELLGWVWGTQFLDDEHWDPTLPRPAWRWSGPLRPPSELLELHRKGEV
jgi:hypothetical protein